MNVGAVVLAAISGGWTVFLPGYVLAVPASVLAAQQWARARRAEKAKHAAEERRAQQDVQDAQRQEMQQEVSDMVKTSLRVLIGTDNLAEINEPSADNPSIRDSLSQALEETAALTSAVGILHRAFELHLAETHGGVVPEWMMRAVSAQQRRLAKRL